MPRPKSDLGQVQIKLGQEDRQLLDLLAAHCEPPTRTQAIREAIRHEARRVRARTEKNGKNSG